MAFNVKPPESSQVSEQLKDTDRSIKIKVTFLFSEKPLIKPWVIVWDFIWCTDSFGSGMRSMQSMCMNQKATSLAFDHFSTSSSEMRQWCSARKKTEGVKLCMVGLLRRVKNRWSEKEGRSNSHAPNSPLQSHYRPFYVNKGNGATSNEAPWFLKI